MKHAQRENEITPEAVLWALRGRVGKANGITATALVIGLTNTSSAAGERRLRACIEHLRNAGHPICATPGDGYFIAANDDELKETCEFLRGRALTSLRQENAMRRIALPELAGQLGLPVTTQGEDHGPTPDA